MTGAIVFGGIITLILTLVGLYNENKEEEEARARRTARKEAESRLPPKQDVESDILCALRELNCHPECYSSEGDDKHKYSFKFQGETFALIVGNSVTTKIGDPYWYYIYKEDVDRYSECRRIINDMNIKYKGYTIYYLEEDDGQSIGICTISSIFVSKDRDTLVKNLETLLTGYFKIHHEFAYRMMQAGLV